jgi:hypothetical protein
MEKLLRCIGNVLPNVASAISDAKNAVHAYLFDRVFDGGHSKQRNDRIIPLPPSNPSHTDGRIIMFPTPPRYNHFRIQEKRESHPT